MKLIEIQYDIPTSLNGRSPVHLPLQLYLQ